MASERASPQTRKPRGSGSRPLAFVAFGFLFGAAGFVGIVSVNSTAGLFQPSSIGPSALVAVGLAVPALGMAVHRREFERSEANARNGLVLMGLGLVLLISGFAALYENMASSTCPAFIPCVLSAPGYLIDTAIVVASGALAIGGAALLRKHYASDRSVGRVLGISIVGTAMIFIGAAMILLSSLAFSTYYISVVERVVSQDVGATISACGCIVESYSFFGTRSAAATSTP